MVRDERCARVTSSARATGSMLSTRNEGRDGRGVRAAESDHAERLRGRIAKTNASKQLVPCEAAPFPSKDIGYDERRIPGLVRPVSRSLHLRRVALYPAELRVH